MPSICSLLMEFFLGGIVIYLLSLVLRQRNLKRDEEMLEQISDQIQEEQAEPAVVAHPEASNQTR